MHAVNLDMAGALKSPSFLGNEELSPWLKLRDCSQVSDGGAGLILCSEEGLAKLGKSPSDCIEVTGCQIATGNLYEDADPLVMPTSAAAAIGAYAMSGTTPDQMDIAEVHDCFTVTELLMAEALGFAEAGKAKDLMRGGAFDIDGSIPINTGGGLVGFGHPVGATGIKQILEIHRQMKGQCGDYQVKHPRPRHLLKHGR